MTLPPQAEATRYLNLHHGRAGRACYHPPDLSGTVSARPIGIWTSVALVMGNMIGSGVFLLPASLAPYRGISLIGWLVSAAGSIFLALVFARLARFNPATGGPYAFTRMAYGDLAGFLVAWGYWISIWSTNAALAIAFVGYLDPFIPTLVRNPAWAATLAVALVWLMTAVNIMGIAARGACSSSRPRSRFFRSC